MNCKATLLAAALLVDRSAAVCTGWAQGRAVQNQDSSSLYGTKMDQLYCPENADGDCYFDKKSYQVTAIRRLYFGSETDHELSDNDTAAIFKLGEDGYNKKLNLTTHKDFVNMDGLVTTSGLGTFETDAVLKIKRGMNATLSFIPYHNHSVGNLSACTDTVLEGKTVEVVAPYADGNTLAGTWFQGGGSTLPSTTTISGQGSTPTPTSSGTAATTTEAKGDGSRPNDPALVLGMLVGITMSLLALS
jgi:hypothetical protein